MTYMHSFKKPKTIFVFLLGHNMPNMKSNKTNIILNIHTHTQKITYSSISLDTFVIFRMTNHIRFVTIKQTDENLLSFSNEVPHKRERKRKKERKK